MRLKILIILLIYSPALLLAQSSSFTIARIKYSGGGDWYSDPTSLGNLMKFVKNNTNIEIEEKEATVSILSDEIFLYPYLYITGHGNIRFSEREVERLRKYLINGGFLHADDNYGMDKSFRREMKKVFPEADFIELPFSHEIYHNLFEFPEGIPKIHEHDGGPPHGFGLFHEGRLVVFYSFNTDLGDGWEDKDVHDNPPEKRLAALKMGTNIIVYSLTH